MAHVLDNVMLAIRADHAGCPVSASCLKGDPAGESQLRTCRPARLRGAALDGAGWFLAAEIQPDPEQAGALLHRVSRGSLQIETQIQGCTRAARAPKLLAAELLT